ncbi:MAG: hypothetical protein M3O70_07720 [Actinomycetota bacterium]|nr:hypothetical protein [Actinomycetota bacterium]
MTRGTTSLAYAYDLVGNVTQRTLPDGTIVAYAYNNDGLLSTVTAGSDTTSYSYDPAGNLTATSLPNAVSETRAYDRSGRVTAIQGTAGATTVSSHNYTRDPVGNPSTVTTPNGSVNYLYDAKDHLTRACWNADCDSATEFIAFSYDPVGNRLSKTAQLPGVLSEPAGTTTYAYDVDDRLTAATGPLGPTSYDYDANGSQTTAGAWNYSYDQANRMASASNTLTTVTYSYDGDGNRLVADAGALPGDETRYQWDPNNPLPLLVEERDGNNTQTREHLHGTEQISMETAGARSYYLHDHLGSTLALTSPSGATQRTYDYLPFGQLRNTTQPDPLAPENLTRFTGQLFDAQTGLYHLRARQYDPTTGRFTATDPVPPQIDDPYVASYIYANNNPTRFIDPSGLSFRDWVRRNANTIKTTTTVVAAGGCIVLSFGACAAAAGVGFIVRTGTNLASGGCVGTIAQDALVTSLTLGVGKVLDTGLKGLQLARSGQSASRSNLQAPVASANIYDTYNSSSCK